MCHESSGTWRDVESLRWGLPEGLKSKALAKIPLCLRSSYSDLLGAQLSPLSLVWSGGAVKSRLGLTPNVQKWWVMVPAWTLIDGITLGVGRKEIRFGTSSRTIWKFGRGDSFENCKGNLIDSCENKGNSTDIGSKTFFSWDSLWEFDRNYNKIQELRRESDWESIRRNFNQNHVESALENLFGEFLVGLR